MPPPPPGSQKSDNQIMLFGTPAEKKALQQRKARERLPKPVRAVEPVPTEPEPAPVVEPALETASDPSAIEIEKLHKALADQKAILDDVYTKLEREGLYVKDLETKLNTAQKENFSIKKEKRGLDSNLDDLERQIAGLEREKSIVTEQLNSTKKELAGFKADKSSVQQWNTTLQADYDALTKKYTRSRNDNDLKSSDLTAAHLQIDELTRQLEAYNGEDIEKARAYMEHINDALDSVFEEQGKDLTPDTFREHFDRVTQQASLNRHASGTSLNSLQSGNGHKRNDSGVRKLSLGDELANHEDSAFESDSDGVAHLDETLRVPKQRKRSSLHFQDIESKISEKDQEIMRQREYIQKLEEESLAQKKAMKDQEKATKKAAEQHDEESAKQEKLIGEYHQEAVKQKLAILEHERILAEERNRKSALPAKKMWGLKRQHLQEIDELSADHADDGNDAAPPIQDEKKDAAEQDVPVRPMVKYHEKVRDATIFEAIMNAPLLHKLFLAFFVFVCLSFGIRGCVIDSLWRNSNAYVADGIHYAQLNYGQISWRTRMEDFVGYDSMLLG